MSRIISTLATAVALMLTTACGLHVTNERPTYEELSKEEQRVVNIVLSELRPLNSNIKALSRNPKVDIAEIVDKEKIHVSFEGLIFVTNIGDNVIHVATWENLTPALQALCQKWWKTTPAATKARYEYFFYRFMATAQGVKQYMYKVLTPAWIFSNRSVFNLERDSIRTALAHYVAVGRKGQMWGFLNSFCAPVLQQYRAKYPGIFPASTPPGNIKAAKKYMATHITEMANPNDPTGYMYFMCEWVQLGMGDAGGLQAELDWLRDLPLP